MAITTHDQLLADYRWLVSPAAAPFLASAAAETDLLARATRLRADLAVPRARLVAEQVALRARAAKKFPAAARLFFTATGLEQATDAWIAAYKAQRFRGAARVFDFCTGIGGDLMALAARAPVQGVDRDPISALLAEANCQAVLESADAVSVSVGEVALAPLTAADFWHIDPDRRALGRRTTHVELHDPPVTTLEALLATAPAGAIKLAPAAEIPPRWRESAELEWISSARECRQLIAWFGPLAQHAGHHRATHVPRGSEIRGSETNSVAAASAASTSFVGRPDVVAPVASAVGRYLFDPDPAFVAARLTGAFATAHGLAALIAGGAYLTADQPLFDPLLTTLAVSEVIPWDVRRLKQALAARRIGHLEVKQRGTRLDPATVCRQLQVPGDVSATLVLYRRGKSVVAILTERIKTPL